MERSIFLLLFTLALNFSHFAQSLETNSKELKIALVNKYEFENEKNGIRKLVEAQLPLYDCDFKAYGLTKEISKLKEELENPPISKDLKEEKQKQLENLKEKLKTYISNREIQYQKRKKILLKPILDEIDSVLSGVAENNKLVILDGVELEESETLLAFDGKIDVTNLLIPAFNNYFKTGLKPFIKIDIPQPKIALINTELFSDEIKGIKEFVSYRKEVEKTIKVDLGDNPTKEQIESWTKGNRKIKGYEVFRKIGEALQNYAFENGFALILDSSKKIPSELKIFHSRDVTNEFISYYNQKNQ